MILFPDNIHLALLFEQKLLTKDIVDKYSDEILSFIKDDIPHNWKQNLDLSILCMNKRRYDLMIQFNLFSYDKHFNANMYQILEKTLKVLKDLIKYKIDYLYSRNDEVLSTIDLRILKIKDLKMDLLEKLVLYDNIQSKLIHLDEKTLNFSLQLMENVDFSKYDMSSVLENIVINISNYKNIIGNTENFNLSEDQINNFIYILQKKVNIFNIKSLEDLKKESFEILKSQYFDNVNLDSLNLDQLKNVLFEKKYGIDLEKAKFIFERYSFNGIDGYDYLVRKN